MTTTTNDRTHTVSKLVVVGLGYVGLPLAVRAAEVGHQVVGVDLDTRKIDRLLAGDSYVEDVSNKRLRRALDRQNLGIGLGWSNAETALEAARDFDIAIIAVPTPLRDGEPDLSYVASAGRMLGYILRRDAAVVLESTTYPGTTEGLLAEELVRTSDLIPGVDFHLGFSPERVDPGNKVYTLQSTPKLVSATTPVGLSVIRDFYDTIVDTTVPVSNPRIAELAKVFENTQANINIALVNELAEICHDLDIDVHEMIEAAMTKGHSMARWVPGPGVGGHCLPIDPMYLAWQTRTALGRPFRFAELADEVNNHRPVYVAERVVQHLSEAGVSPTGASVLVLGVAYKPNVGDTRESPALQVIDELEKRGMSVTVVDPHVPQDEWSLTPMLPADTLDEYVTKFPISVVVTDHKAFDFEQIATLAPLVLDCRNSMKPSPKVIPL